MSIRPKRALGQHWLVDENILHVIGRLGELDDDDVVLEIGPGLGVLTTYLADRVRLVHAIEVDRALEGTLRERLAERDNVDLVFGDALQLLDAGLEPPPDKLVANLPYNVATPVVLESVAALPTVELWCVMVQREVADRFFAAPGTKDYGAVSVVLQLAAERTGFHPVARTCFRPPPNVDSALVAFHRTRPWSSELERVRRLAQAAFAHRRKTLANSLDLAGFVDRERAAAALAELGRDSGVRAEALTPGELLRLSELLA
ncbi:MAG: 16S rRNA (adenine(1518)-N(6)/adenine(1519)-N(6))-dimethyltransferase RsmA [Gaiellaceae bacterium]